MNNRNELKPRKPWSDEEDNILRSEIARQGGAGPIPRDWVDSCGELAKQERVNDWRTIATKLPGRSNKDCRKRWMKLDGSVNKGSWSEEEDQRLRKAVRLHLNVWTEVARVVETRHADREWWDLAPWPSLLYVRRIVRKTNPVPECAKRWLHFLNPELDHSRWTEQDDERLWAEVERGGRNWRKIVDEVLEGRSATDAKNRYTILQRGKLNSKTAAQRSTGSGMDRRNSSNTRKRSGSRSRSAVGSSAVETRSINTMDVIKDELSQSSFANEEICLDNAVGGMTLQQLDAGFNSLGDSNFVNRQPDDFLMIDWEPSSLPREGNDISNLNFAGGQYSSEESMNSYPDMNCAGMDTPADFLSPIYFQSPGCFGFESPTQQVAMSRWSGDTEVEEDDEDKDTTEGEPDTPANQLSQAESSVSNRRSTIVLEHMQPDLVGQILTLLLSSDSKVEVKIISQDEWPVITQGYIADGQWGGRTSA